MFSLSRLAILISAFFLGFAASAGAIAGVAYYAVNSISINKIEELTAQIESINSEKDEIQVSLDEKIMAEQEKEAIDALLYVPSNYPVTGASSVMESEEVVALDATSTSIRPVAVFTGSAVSVSHEDNSLLQTF